MVDEKKTILMTRLAIFEKKEAKKSLIMSKYYSDDYVRLQVLKTWVATTVLYWSIVAGYVFMAFDSLLSKINDLDYFKIVYQLLGGYVLVCAVYFLFATIVYRYRYEKAKKGLTQYNIDLKALIHADDVPVKAAVYDQEEPEKPKQNQAEQMRTNQRGNVSRMAMIQRQLDEEQERKNQEILANVAKRNERLAAQKEAELRKQREIEEERRRIRERRERLEREQLQKLREERAKKQQYTGRGDR
ncbi:MAG: hypothetical protein ACI4EK_05595 [Wujia sp.]